MLRNNLLLIPPLLVITSMQYINAHFKKFYVQLNYSATLLQKKHYLFKRFYDETVEKVVETLIGKVEEQSLTHTSLFSYYINVIQLEHILRNFKYS